MRPLGEPDLSDRGKASLGSCEYTAEVTLSSAGAINLALPSGELLLGAIVVVITRDIWKRANMSLVLLTETLSSSHFWEEYGSRFILPGLRAPLGGGGKEQPMCGCLRGAQGPVRPSPAQARGPTTVAKGMVHS
uniref:Uncharacterized protein n=1 Tax=Pipistrellus kuhlii TaxID=59472 RepID=A0A7J7UG92_PIPKU|nr:hypothetical protein mPipKuh1_009089 [Pipistrellus kuhlii]